MTAKALEELAEGKLCECTFDLLRRFVSMTVEAYEGDERFRYTVVVRGLYSFRLQYDPSGPWDYVELTDLEGSRVVVNGEDMWRLESEIWDEPNSRLELVCKEVEISDGKRVKA